MPPETASSEIEESTKKKIIVVGGGFAGTWSALGAARKAHITEIDGKSLEVFLVNPDPWLTIRPRLYECSFRDARIWLDRLMEPVGVERIQGIVTDINPVEQTVEIVEKGDSQCSHSFDGLVLSAGSQVIRPSIPGLDDHTFTVDTYDEAVELDEHLAQIATSGQPVTIAVIGAGFTGLEVATEMVGRLNKLLDEPVAAASQVTLIDRTDTLGQDLGVQPQPVVEKAIESLDIDTVLGNSVTEIREETILLEDGLELPADIVIWTGGMRANPLAASLGDSLEIDVDELDRLVVDDCLRVDSTKRLWAAGDIAQAMADDTHATLQSCQHALQMGRVAGHNVAASLLGEQEITYVQPQYVTCLDLGPWGALFTEGWERAPKVSGPEAKAIKRWINWDRITPPTSGQPDDLFQAADPEYSPVS